jgi:hypothetical protein
LRVFDALPRRWREGALEAATRGIGAIANALECQHVIFSRPANLSILGLRDGGAISGRGRECERRGHQAEHNGHPDSR